MFYELFKMMFLAMFGSREAADRAASNVAGNQWYVMPDDESHLQPGKTRISELGGGDLFDVTPL